MSEGGELQLKKIDRPAEAVADAMLVAQSQMMSEVIKNPLEYLKDGTHTDPTEQMEDLAKSASRGMCEYASVTSLYYLSQRYPDLFDTMAILTTYDNYRSPKGHLKDRMNEYHTYFIVKDKQGVWYAASPANHTLNEESSSLTRVIKSADPQEVVSMIEKVDGGEWPSGDFIQQEAQGKDYAPPIEGKSKQNGKPILNVFRISNLYGHNRAFIDEAYLPEFSVYSVPMISDQ